MHAENGNVVGARNRGPSVPEGLNEAAGQRGEEFRSAPGLRVLLMDDDRLVLDTLGRQLRALGCEVVTTAEGRSAVLMYEGARRVGQRFDLVFLDLLVKDGWGGEETLRELRRLDPQVRAVICSGSLTRTSAEYRQLGCFSVLAKPFTLEQVRILVSSLEGFGGRAS